MRTTELFVEQVLIGLMVLVIALPFTGFDDLDPENAGSTLLLFKGLGILAVAYLVGMPFDRFADTILASLERRHRLLFCRKMAKRGKYEISPEQDAFPEDLLKVAITQAQSGTVAHVGYIRTRQRLTRSLAVYLPAIMISGLIRVGGETFGPVWRTVTVAVILFVYGVAFTLVRRRREELPRTDRISIVQTEDEPRISWSQDPLLEDRLTPGRDPVMWPRRVLAIWAVLLCAVLHTGTGLAITVAGLLGAWLSGWSWWRITKTHMKLLWDFGRFSRPPFFAHLADRYTAR